MKKVLVLVLALAALLCVAVTASAVTIPENVKDLDIPEIPALPEMKCKNDGLTQTITFSEPVDWMAAIFCDGHDWTWNDVSWTSPEHTEATVDMTAHKQSPGYGFWASSNYDDEGNCTWSGTGFYEMDYAYDVVLKDGTDVKYNQFGEPREVTLKKPGSEFFGFGPSIGTTILVKFKGNSVGKFVPYVYEIKEDYRNGTSTRAFFAMNGAPTYMIKLLGQGKWQELYKWSAPGQDTLINGWIDLNTPDEDIPLEEGQYIVVSPLIYHGGVWDQELNDGAGDNVEIALSEEEYADQANWPKRGYNTWSLWWIEGHKEVWQKAE